MSSWGHLNDLASDSYSLFFDGFDLVFVVIDENIFEEGSLIFVFEGLFILPEPDFLFFLFFSFFVSVD